MKGVNMKVKDILSKIIDNYYQIVIEVFDNETNLIKNRYFIEPHKADASKIPDSVMEMEVGMIIPYYDRLSICVKEK